MAGVPAQTQTGNAATTAATMPRPSPTSTSATTRTAPAPSGTVVSSRDNPKYGAIVTDSDGRTLYLYTPDDGQSSPQCTGSCAKVWPPLDTTGRPRAEGGAQQSLLGTEDGQVTYNGHPLYYYTGDSGPGQTNGEGSAGIWYVVSTSGNPVLG